MWAVISGTLGSAATRLAGVSPKVVVGA